METLYALGHATVRDVQEALGDVASYNSIRVTLGILEDKGFVIHGREGRSYVYRAKGKIESAKQSAMRQLLNTFFGGSAPSAVSAFLDIAAAELTDRELDDLARQIKHARKETSR